VFYNNRWNAKTNDPNAFFPRQAGVTAGNFTDRNFLNAAYLRLKNLVIGYTLPVTLTNKIGISKLRITASGTNLDNPTQTLPLIPMKGCQ
jgi:uncharacterized membrane protein